MDTKIIEYIITIAEEKSLSKAAEKLFLTQPALSQRLKKLETELGTPLFTRENNKLLITDAGRIYINGGRSILRIKQTAMQQLASMGQSSKTMLRFGCATTQALECIPAFREKYPQIELHTWRGVTPTVKEALIMGRLDIAVLLTTSLQHSALEYIPLSQNELLLALPPNHPLANVHEDLPEHFAELERDLFFLNPKPSFLRDTEDQILQSMGIHPQILCEVVDHISSRYMLNRGLGNSFLPSYAVQKEDSFHVFSLEPKRSFYTVAAYPKTLTLSDPMKYMLKLLLTLFEA